MSDLTDMDEVKVIEIGLVRKKPFGLDDFVVIADERNNPPELLAKENFTVTVAVAAPYVRTEITFDREGKIVAINGVDVKDRLYAI